MLALESSRWSELQHACGAASGLPSLLRDLASLPPDEGQEAEPYFSLWSSLCHQSDAYTASFAAVPHIVSIMEAAPLRTPWTLFLLISCIEIARSKGKAPEVPDDLKADYFDALSRIPHICELCAEKEWDWWFSGAALSALAAAKGQHLLAECILCCKPDYAKDIIENHAA